MDKTPIPSNINLRSKGLSRGYGKLHKGCVKDATTKLSIGSIPSTYESIIYKSQSKKVFGTSEKRFYDKTILTSCISNSEEASTIESMPPQIKTDYNTQGQNSFISKQKRECFRTVRTPGPAHYYNGKENNEFQPLSRNCITRQSRKSLGRKFPCQRSNEKKEDFSPGPGQYIFEKKQFWRTTSKGWKSSFDTKIGRDGYIPQSVSPGPGCYSTQQQKKIKPAISKQIEKQDLKPDQIMKQFFNKSSFQKPGPGSYNQEIPNFKPLYERIKMSGSFMTPIYHGRKKQKVGPGPTAYEVKRMYDNLEPKLIESTFFMSQTKRQPFIPKNIQGPNLVPPPLVESKNFHFNIKNQWIC